MDNAVADRQAGGSLLDLTLCDVEPIHIPGSIQPHGLLFVVDAQTSIIVAGAGDVEGRLAANWLGQTVTQFLPDAWDPARLSELAVELTFLGQVTGTKEAFDVSGHKNGSFLLVEFEPVPDMPASAGAMLTTLDNMASALGRAIDLQMLCEEAALAFRSLTGFDRVMIYRFVEDDAGVVVAAAHAPDMPSFLNHHFPASDIPKQARALYVRNRVRVIPDVAYGPAPLRSLTSDPGDVDMSDLALRSVSPIHLQYLRNMGVGASASVSIVKDGILWGLVACHHETPRQLGYAVRAACRSLAGSLARQIRSKEEAANYRERIRLRAAEDVIVAYLGREAPHDDTLGGVREDMQHTLGADGFAFVQGNMVHVSGKCPGISEIRELSEWLLAKTTPEPFSTHQLGDMFTSAAAYRSIGSGVLAVTLSVEEPGMFLWFRAEQLQVINWAGNPHKDIAYDPKSVLNPRASFEDWAETVKGRARRWTLGEIESAARLRSAVFETRQNRRLREVNRELVATLADKEGLLRQKDYLVKEVNHRVQNSLQLVAAFLSMQVRSLDDSTVIAHLSEAQKRLSAVALVHKRLYRDDSVEAVDLARYLEDICLDMQETMGNEWKGLLTFELAPLLISTDRAVNMGLILTELIINANKYAYHGAPGPVVIRLEQHSHRFRLVVTDRGVGSHQPGKGFGTRMMTAMVERLAGTIEFADNAPGLRVAVDAPMNDDVK